MNFLADYCCCLVIKSCPILCDCVDCSLPGSSVHGISQAKTLVWVGTSTSRASSWPDPGINPCLLHWQVGSLSNEPSEKSLLADWTLKNKNQWTDICASRNNPDYSAESKAYWEKKNIVKLLQILPIVTFKYWGLTDGRHRCGRDQLTWVHQQLPLLFGQSGSFPISETVVHDSKVWVVRCWFSL